MKRGKENSHPEISNDDITIRIFRAIQDIFRSRAIKSGISGEESSNRNILEVPMHDIVIM